MRKMVFGRKLSRGKKSREALIRSLIKALIGVGKIETTKAKAKAIQGQVDKLVTMAKKNTLSSRRRVLAYLANDRKATDNLVSNIAPVFKDRKGGYTRIILLGKRLGDAAEMARLEWVEQGQVITSKKEEVKEVKETKETKKAEPKTKAKTTKKAKTVKKTVKKETKKK
jgi:large subunit ribosomal protein L17